MPVTDPRFLALFPIQEVIIDKDTGLPLSAGIVSFYFDDPARRTSYKPIYQQVQLPDKSYDFVQINNPITLTSVGTFADDNGNDIIPFLFPYEGTPGNSDGTIEKYYITVYAAIAPVGNGSLQFTRENWPPNADTSTSPTDLFEGTLNEISNSQFASVLIPISSSSTFTVTGNDTVNRLANDWDLITSGSGTVTVQQIGITDTNAPSNPAFAIDVSSGGAGLTGVKLRQRWTQSPRLLAQGYASSNLVAKSLSGLGINIVMNYVSSDGTTIELINKTTTTSGFSTLQNDAPSFIDTANADSGLTGYVDIEIVIPVLAHVQITCVQVVGVQNATSQVQYLQQTTEQEIMKYQLAFKPIPSFLIGWDFPLNPAQLGSTQTITTTPAYIWDQTICASSTANLAVIRGSSGTSSFVATTTGATEAFYMLQYLSGDSAHKIALTNLAVNIQAYCTTHPGVVARVYIYKGSTASSIPALPTTIGTIANTGVFTLTAANWSLITQTNGNSNQVSVPTDNPTNLGLSGWEAAGYGSIENFAIVVTFAIPTLGTSVSISSISCVPGDIPTLPAPQSIDEVLRECQYYYEKSYAPATAVGTASTTNALIFSQNTLLSTGVGLARPCNMYQTGFGFSYKQIKRIAPTMTLYSTITLNTPAVITGYITYHAVGGGGTNETGSADITWATYWVTSTIGTQAISFSPVTAQIDNTPFGLNTGAGNFTSAASWVSFHYTLDARLGIV